MIFLGAEGDAFYIIEKGSFDIMVTEIEAVTTAGSMGGQGTGGDKAKEEICRTKKVAEAGRGQAVGEYALLYNTPRTATLIATEDSLVWGIDAEKFIEIRKKVSEFNIKRFEELQDFLKAIPLFC